MRHRNESLKAVLRELAAAGIHHRISNGGRHLRVEWNAGNGPRVTIVAASASDHRAPRNARAYVRRQLRGALK
jgi:hypothetical protein